MESQHLDQLLRHASISDDNRKNIEQMRTFMPLSSSVDPRNKELIIYAPQRARRPHTSIKKEDENIQSFCPICKGERTPLFLQKKLPSGHSLDVDFNLYPMLNPDGIAYLQNPDSQLFGVHFVVWISTEHKDIHQLSYDDHTVTFRALGELEEKVHHVLSKGYYTQVIKNTGKAVGGSLEHGHYQVGFLNYLPRRIQDDLAFIKKHKTSFVDFMLKKNPQDLTVREYDSVKVTVPYFMRRPLDAFILPLGIVQSFKDLTERQCIDFARASTDIARALSKLMPEMGREFAYNIIFHTHVGAMYAEILPFTQEEGGFEKIGLSVCQSTPQLSAESYQAYFSSMSETQTAEKNNL